MLKRKRIISFVMVIIFVLELPFITYKKAEVNATVAIPVIVGAGQALAGVLGTALACLGIVGIGKSALDATDKKLEEMSEAEQEEYYNNTYTNTQSAIKKLYQDGYLSDMKTLDEAVGHMLANDDEACTVSLKMFLDENDLTKDDLKVYNSGKKDKNGNNKPFVAVSDKLLDLLLNACGNAIENMITDKKITNEDTDLEMALSTVPTAQQAHDAILKEYNYKGTDGDRLYLVTDYVFFKAENMDDNSSLYMRNKSGYYVLWSNLCKNQGYDLIEYHKTVYNPKPTHEVPTLEYGSLEKNGCYILFYFDSESEEWQCLTGQNIAYYLSSYSGIGISLYPADRVTIMFNNKDLKLCRYVDFDTNTTDMYDYHIKANPLPDVLGNNTQIINYYFGDTVTVCEDVYNCVTNQITNNYYTENNYLLPTDPVDVGKDIIIPAQNIINNTYNSIDPDVTVDKDYIDKVLVPTIINGINANLDLNTDVNLPDLTIDDVVDFTGNAGDDYTLNTVTFFGLEEKFPFCLPWDVYYFLDCLDAEPRAPAFTVVIPLCSIGMEDCQLKIDLSELDYFFKMLRYAELFLACFGLVFLTKKIISGG